MVTKNSDNSGETILNKKAYEVQLKKLEEAYQLNPAILQSNPEIIMFALDCNYRYIIFNKKHIEIMKIRWDTKIEIGMNMLDAIRIEEDYIKAKTNYDRTLSGESFSYFEEFEVEPLGYVYWQVNFDPIISGDGKILGLIGFMQDITERVKTELALKEEMAFQEALLESIPGLLYVYNEEGRLIKWNKKHETMTGYSKEELSKMTLDQWYKGEDIQRVAEAAAEVFKSGYAEIETNLYRKNGEPFFISCNGVRLELGGKTYFVGIGTDVTKQRQNEEIIRRSEARHRSMIENISDVITIVDKDGIVRFKSPNIKRLFGWEQDDLIGMEYLECAHPEDKDMLKREFEWIMQRDGEKANVEFRYKHKDGSYSMIELTAVNLINNPDINGILANYKDITERKSAEEQILKIINHDQLTGIYNRRFYEQELIKLDKRVNLPIALIMVDVNGLKLINDAFGHQLGDILLKKIANILVDVCGSLGIVSRVGGDEFILLLKETDTDKANRLIERINMAIENETIGNIILSVAIGFAVKQDTGEDMNEVFREAEDDLYRHKLSESSSMRSKTIEIIMNSLYEKNDREMMHSQRVGEMCETIARNMKFAKHETDQMKIAGLMHDIGKIGIQDAILNKVGKLNLDEWEQIKKHSEIGYRILSSANEFSEIANYILEHQEKWDGTGYPRGLRNEEISIQARIIAVADSYDAMTSDRTYRKRLSEEEAINEIIKNSGTQFDPNIAKIFIEKVLGKSL